MQRIYLDYAATTPVDARVKSAMMPYFDRIFGNPNSLHLEGQRASAGVFRARVKIAGLIGAEYGQVVFTGSATEANNLALRGAVKRLKKPRIVVSAIEHESVLETARDLERGGAEVVYLPVSGEGIVDLKKLEKSLNGSTILVSVMYANNEIGSIQPITKVAEIIRLFKRGMGYGVEGRGFMTRNTPNPKPNTPYPLFHTDAVQAFQYLDCDVNRLGIDLMTLSAHKIYGPKGIGALYVKQATRDKRQETRRFTSHVPCPMSPIITGGGQESGLRSGTENTALIAGFAKAVELAAASRASEGKRIAALAKRFWIGIKQAAPGARLNGPEFGDKRLPNNLNVYFPGVSAQDMLIKLDLSGIAASSGSACASRSSKPSYILSAMGLGSGRASESVRFTLGRQTKAREIDKAVSLIKNILRNKGISE